MKTTKPIAMLTLAALLALPTMASAQFGSLGKLRGMAPGQSATTVSSGDADAFLVNAAHSTKNVMISAALLSIAVTDRTKLTASKAALDALQNTQDIQELDAHRDELSSNLAVLNGRADLAGDLNAAYTAGDAHEKKVISIAVANLAIGILRNTQLAGQAPAMVKGVGGNPALLSRVGQFKLAAGLLGLQAKGLGGIASSMPRLLAAAKVSGPAASTTSEPQAVVI
jgi:hypothetical protein